MRKTVGLVTGAAFLACGTISVFAQATSPAPSTKQPAQVQPAPGTGSGSAAMGPPASPSSAEKSTPKAPGASSIPGGPHNEAEKSLDAATQGGSGGK